MVRLSTRRRATTAAGSAGAATSRTLGWPPRTRCAGRPGRPTPTPCGTGTACTARASAATTRPPSPTASCAVAAAPRAARYNALDTIGAWKAKRCRTTSRLTLHRRGQSRRRLHPDVRHEAGLQPDHPAARLGRPGAGRPDGNTPASRGPGHQRCLDRDPGERAGPHRPAHRLHDLAGQPPGPAVLPVQRRDFGGGTTPTAHHRHADDDPADADPPPPPTTPPPTTPPPAGACTATYQVTGSGPVASRPR